MSLAYLALAVALVIYLWRRSNRTESKSTTSLSANSPLVEYDGVKIDREWWPRYRVIGKQVFPFVRIKDIEKVGEWPHLERWWHRESMGRYYDVIVDGADFLDPEDCHEDKFEMKRGWEAIYEDNRLFLEWAAIGESYSERKNVYEVTANVCERIGTFPWENEKGAMHYLHKRSWNIMIGKTQDPEELATMMEAKMAENASKG